MVSKIEDYHLKRLRMIHYLGISCAKCGSKDDLEFNHKDPKQKSFDISKSWSKPWSVLVPELDKCELLCHNCHVEHHMAPHGTRSRYRTCKCSKCTLAQSTYMRNYKANR